MNKYLNYITLIIWLFLSISCSSNSDTARTIKHEGTIKFNPEEKILEFDINSTIAFNGNKVRFFLGPNFNQVKINGKPQPVIVYRNEIYHFYNFEKENTNNDTFKVNFQYSIRLENARSIKIKDDNFYILTDQYYLPGFHRYRFQTDSITCILNILSPNDSLRIIHPANQKLSNGVTQIVTDYIPSIIAGSNYSQKELNTNLLRYNIIYKNDIVIDNQKINKVVEFVDKSYTFYLKTLGDISNKSNELSIYFLDRTGGHLIDGGIILDQKNIDSKSSLLDTLIIPHEIAHLWWGDEVKIENTGFQESITEYTSTLFFSSLDPSYGIVLDSKKNIELELSSGQPYPFKKLMAYSSGYKNIAYKRGPLIIKNIETKIGKEEMLFTLKKIFESRRNQTISLETFCNGFHEYPKVKDELEYYLDGGEWPDFKVDLVDSKSISFTYSDNKYYSRIPVQIILENESYINDTFDITKSKGEIIKQYNSTIIKAIIDPNFTLIQKDIKNDYWSVEGTNLYNPKLPKLYNDKYYTYFDKMYEYLICGKDLQQFVFTDSTSYDGMFKKVVNFSKKIKGDGYFLYLSENRNGTLEFSFIVVYYLDNKRQTGEISGTLLEKYGLVKIINLSKVKI
ncbi:MAG: M1 family aminopeptidase [Tenuifilaceae bacterium]